MRLSEAIRLGAMLKPQAFGDLVRDGATCAIGAAYDAAGILERVCNCQFNEHEEMIALIRAEFPILAVESPYSCPVCGCCEFGLIPHLNDHHRWTREQIADWVEQLEAIPGTPEDADASRAKKLEHEDQKHYARVDR